MKEEHKQGELGYIRKQHHKCCGVTFHAAPRVVIFTKAERTGVQGLGELVLNGDRISFATRKDFWRWMAVMVAQKC
jgi:hypothetical protein